MRQLCDAVWREAEEEAAEDRRRRVAGEVASEQERTEPRQHVRQQQRDVIAEDRVAGREVHRQHQQCLRDEMFRVRECEGSRMEERPGFHQSCHADQWPVASAVRCSDDQRRIHVLRTGSPISHGTERCIAVTSGHVQPTVSTE